MQPEFAVAEGVENPQQAALDRRHRPRAAERADVLHRALADAAAVVAGAADDARIEADRSPARELEATHIGIDESGDAAKAEGLGQLRKVDMAGLDVGAQMRGDTEGLAQAQPGRVQVAVEHRDDERAIERDLARAHAQPRQRGREHAGHRRQLERRRQRRHRHRLDHDAAAALPARRPQRQGQPIEHQRAIEHRNARAGELDSVVRQLGIDHEGTERELLPAPAADL